MFQLYMVFIKRIRVYSRVVFRFLSTPQFMIILINSVWKVLYLQNISCTQHCFLCAARGATAPSILSDYVPDISFRQDRRSISSCFRFFLGICQKISLSSPRKSIPELLRRAPRQMLMNDRQRSKLVMDTFMDWALDLPDYDVCFLATGSHQISGGCQLKSTRIISQTGCLLYGWIPGSRNRHTQDNKERREETDPAACLLLTAS